MKSKLSLLIMSLIIVVILAGCGNSVEQDVANQHSSQAEQVIQYLAQADYIPIIEQFDDQMKAQLTETELAQITPIVSAAGDYIGVKKSTVQLKDGFYVTVSVVEFSKKTTL